MILLFGSNSFVSKNLKVDHKVSRQECDLTKYDQVLKALRKYRPSHVINCAAAHGSAKTMSLNNAEYMTTNIIIDSNILKAAHSLDIDNIILMSSISAFPEVKGRDINENDLHIGEVNKYNFGYNSSKRISSDLCESYILDYKRNYRALFLGNLYGEHANFKVDSNMLNSIIFQIHNSKLMGKNLTLYGTGEDQRAFTYVNDLNDFIPKFFAKREIKSCIFSSSEVFSVREIVEKVRKIIGFKGTVQFSGEVTNNQKRKVASVEYLSKSFPDFRYTPFEVGLEKTIAWFLNSTHR
jgi:GDP-L-fucose synthase